MKTLTLKCVSKRLSGTEGNQFVGFAKVGNPAGPGMFPGAQFEEEMTTAQAEEFEVGAEYTATLTPV